MTSSPAHNPRLLSDLVYDCRPLHWEAQDLPETTRPAEHNPAPPQPESDESRRGMRAHTVRRKDRGQAIVEYAAVIALIGVCLVAILSLVGNATKKAFERTSSTVDRNASVPAGGGAGGAGGGGGVHVIPASAPGAPDSSDDPEKPNPEDPDSMTIAHNP